MTERFRSKRLYQVFSERRPTFLKVIMQIPDCNFSIISFSLESWLCDIELFFYLRANFNRVSQNQNQRNYFGQSKRTTLNPVNQSKLEVITHSRHKARENVYARATVGFDFTSDWLKKWRENFEPITEWSNHKPKQFAHYFRHSSENRSDSQFKISYM